MKPLIETNPDRIAAEREMQQRIAQIIFDRKRAATLDPEYQAEMLKVSEVPADPSTDQGAVGP